MYVESRIQITTFDLLANYFNLSSQFTGRVLETCRRSCGHGVSELAASRGGGGEGGVLAVLLGN